jgi:hypothetical protein
LAPVFLQRWHPARSREQATCIIVKCDGLKAYGEITLLNLQQSQAYFSVLLSLFGAIPGGSDIVKGLVAEGRKLYRSSEVIGVQRLQRRPRYQASNLRASNFICRKAAEEIVGI